MNLPKSVNIFGYTCSIQEVSPCLDDDGNPCEGLFDYKNSIIFINKKQSNEDKLHTFIHEIGHAMFYRVSLGQTSIDGELEEIIVNNHATLMTEIFNLRIKRKKG